MQEVQALEDLTTPRLEHLHVDLLESAQICLECARCHELRDKHEELSLRCVHLPVVEEAHNVGVLKALQHLSLLTKALPLTLVEAFLQFTPGNRHTRGSVQPFVHRLEGPTANFLFKLKKATIG